MVRRGAQAADVLFKKNIRHGRVSGQDNEPGQDGKAGYDASKQPAHTFRKNGHAVSLRGIGKAGHDVRACSFLGVQGTASGKDGAVPGKSPPGDARRSEINGQHTGLRAPGERRMCGGFLLSRQRGVRKLQFRHRTAVRNLTMTGQTPAAADGFRAEHRLLFW